MGNSSVPTMTSPAQKTTGRRASALFTVLCALAVFAIFTAAVASMVIERVRGTKRGVLQKRANYACEAGFVLATEWLEQQINYNNAANSLTFAPMIDATNFNNLHTNITLANDKLTLLTVRITSNMLPPAAGPASAITGPNGVLIQPGQVYVQTVATVGGDLAPASSRHLGGFASLGTQNFPYAIMCEGPINLTNTNLLTYTSYDLGKPNQALCEFWEYHTLEADWFPVPKLKLKHNGNCVHNGGGMPGGGSLFPGQARVLSNGRVKAVTLNNSKVDGQLFCGAGVAPAAAITTSPAQSWVPPPAASAFPIFITKYKPPMEPNSAWGNCGGGTVNPGVYYKTCNVSGGTLTFNCSQPGANEFYFSESMILNGVNVRVASANVNSRAKIYVGKQLTMNNCNVNMLRQKEGNGAGPGTGKSPLWKKAQNWDFNIEFLGVGGGGVATNPTGQTKVNITGGSVLALFAGAAMDFNMSGGEFHGAIKCNSVNMTGVNMWYDVGVNANAITNSLWGRVSWTMTGVTDYGDALYLEALAGLPGGAAGLLPQGPAGVCAGVLGAGTAVNLGANGGAVIAGPNVGLVGTGAAAVAASLNAAGSSPSFWAVIFLGQ